MDAILSLIVQISSIALAPLTLGLVLLTWVLAKETRKTRQQNKHPNIIVTIEPNRRHMMFADLVIENVGSGPAYNLRATFNPDITISRNGKSKPISDMSVLRLPMLKPKQTISTFLGKWDEIEIKPSTVTCTCNDSDGTKHTVSNAINMSVYDDLSHLGTDHLEKIDKHLEKMSRAVDRVANGHARLGVNTYDASDRIAETQEN